MNAIKLGVLVDNLGLGVRPGIEKAAELGLDGIQVFCTRGEMHPDNLSESGRRDFRKFVESKGLTLSAVCAHFGPGLKDPDANNERVPLVAKSLTLAREVGTDIATLHVGSVSEDETDPGRLALVEALKDLSPVAEREGVVIAAETGGESPETLRAFLESLGLDTIKVNLDPANLVMKGYAPLEAVETLAPFIVHAHVKDAKRGEGEAVVGEGDVPWPEYLARLEGVGYRGFHAIEREGGRDRVADVARAAEFLRGL